MHQDGLTEVFTSEHRLLHKNGVYHRMMARGVAERDPSGRARRIIGSITNISGQRLAEERLLHDAFHDPLTGLPNGAMMRERLERAMVHAERRHGYTYAVLFLDIDRFKNVNDSLGHLEGDQLLMAIAGRLKSCVRPMDVVARLRWGRVHHLPGRHLGPRRREARRGEGAARSGGTYRLNGQEVYVSASIGIAISAETESPPRYLVRDADAAMYHAKARGGGSYDSMHAKASQVLSLESALRRALSKQELRLHYQPIVSFRAGESQASRRLCAGTARSEGIIPPDEFIPVAEETRLIVPSGAGCSGRLAADDAVARPRIRRTPPLTMSVNLSCRQFFQPDLIYQVKPTVLRGRGVEPTAAGLGDDRERGDGPASRRHAADAQAAEGPGRAAVRWTTSGGYSSLSYIYQFPFAYAEG